MTYGSIVYFLEVGRAMKPADWRGYVVKSAAAEGANEGSFTLTWKDRAGNQYVYDVDGVTHAWSVHSGSTAIPNDGQFMAAMAADNWTTGTVADFEAVRGGTGTGW